MNDNTLKFLILVAKLIAAGALLGALMAADYYNLSHFEVILMLVTACLSALGVHGLVSGVQIPNASKDDAPPAQ